jgi:CRP-like cAMP-binding protein
VDSSCSTGCARSTHQYLPGERVVRQGEPGQELYVILNGTADVAVRHDGLVTTIATMDAGQFFGEISFLTGAPRSSTVTATTPLGVLSIGRESISAVMHGNERLVEEMSRVVVKRQLVSQAAIDQMSKESQAQALARQQQSLMDRIRRYFWG